LSGLSSPGRPILDLGPARSARARGNVGVVSAPAPPLIAVTTSELRPGGGSAVTAEADPSRPEMVLGLSYLEAIGQAGGLPVVVPPLPAGAIGPFLDRVSGVCLSGGPDLHPAAYDAVPHERLGPTEPRFDAFELALARAADERGLPVLAICRGAQVVNVARGGALHQHLPDAVGEAVQHRQTASSRLPTHPVTIAPRSRLAAILGRRRIEVNSFHHQAASRIGEGLVPCAWAPDGVVEAFEVHGDRFLVGVQWHAECLTVERGHDALFAAFVAAAAGAGVEQPLSARRAQRA
jgi:putative glutamine amidotransferase